jgi:hypothetical protein
MTPTDTREFQSAADMARDAAFLLDPQGKDHTVALMVAVIAYLADHPEDHDLDGRLLERAAQVTWPDGPPAQVRARLGLDSNPLQ